MVLRLYRTSLRRHVLAPEIDQSIMVPDTTLLVNIIAEVRATSVFGTASRSISLVGFAGFADAHTPTYVYVVVHNHAVGFIRCAYCTQQPAGMFWVFSHCSYLTSLICLACMGGCTTVSLFVHISHTRITYHSIW